jgi:hypothetical protein
MLANEKNTHIVTSEREKANETRQANVVYDFIFSSYCLQQEKKSKRKRR